MSDDTPNLALPLIQPAQAQKHITHNEALALLDAIVHLSVEALDATIPPPVPDEGQAWGIGPGAEGAWADRVGSLAYFVNGGFVFLEPRDGMRAWNRGDATLNIREGGAWRVLMTRSLGDLEGVGINADHDLENRLAVASPATLLTHEGAGHRLKINKAGAGDTASLVFQTGFSGRAEMGLAGSDDFSMKVSANGTDWTTALSVDAPTGAVTFPNGQRDAKTGLAVPPYVPAPVTDIFRTAGMTASTPRGYAMAAVSGALVSVDPSSVDEIFQEVMTGVVMVRVWNVSKSPAQPGWVVSSDRSAGTLTLRDASETAGWAARDILQLGDPNPTGDNVKGMVALDISPYLQASFGSVFAQSGLSLYLYENALDGPLKLSVSGRGAAGTLLDTFASDVGGPGTVCVPLPTPTPSPVSDSNLVFVGETLNGASGNRYSVVRLVGLYP